VSGKGDGKRDDERRDVLRFETGSAGKDAKLSAISIDAYSLASQRRAIAYGRARGNV